MKRNTLKKLVGSKGNGNNNGKVNRAELVEVFSLEYISDRVTKDGQGILITNPERVPVELIYSEYVNDLITGDRVSKFIQEKSSVVLEIIKTEGMFFAGAVIGNEFIVEHEKTATGFISTEAVTFKGANSKTPQVELLAHKNIDKTGLLLLSPESEQVRVLGIPNEELDNQFVSAKGILKRNGIEINEYLVNRCDLLFGRMQESNGKLTFTAENDCFLPINKANTRYHALQIPRGMSVMNDVLIFTPNSSENKNGRTTATVICCHQFMKKQSCNCGCTE